MHYVNTVVSERTVYFNIVTVKTLRFLTHHHHVPKYVFYDKLVRVSDHEQYNVVKVFGFFSWFIYLRKFRILKS